MTDAIASRTASRLVLLRVLGRAVILAGISAVAVCAGSGLAAARPSGDTAAQVAEAIRAVDAGEHAQAAALARAVIDRADAPAPDITEAWRVLGLALFFSGDLAGSEAAFLRYLQRDVDGRLDPSLVPPEAIVFFEDVRARHAAELSTYRPKPRSRWTTLVRLIPVAGQVQNGHRKKAVAIAVTAGAALAANLTSYFMLRSWCDEITGVCENSAGESRADAARTARALNIASGIALIGLYGYAVLDAFLAAPDDERATPPARIQAGVAPIPGGAMMVLGGSL